MTIPAKTTEASKVVVAFRVDLPSKTERRGWRTQLFVEAWAPHDLQEAAPTIADCQLQRTGFELEAERRRYLVADGKVLGNLHDPYGHLSVENLGLPDLLKKLPYFREGHIRNGHIPDNFNALDGEPVRTWKGTVVVPLGQPSGLVSGDEDFDPEGISDAAAEARLMASTSLRLRPQGWFVDEALPEWNVYHWRGRTGVLLANRNCGSIGGTFAIDRLDDAIRHAERLHGPGVEIVGDLADFDPSLLPASARDETVFAKRIARFLSAQFDRRPESMDRVSLERWHDLTNAAGIIAVDGDAGILRVLEAADAFGNDHLWNRSRRHELGWQSEKLRVRDSIETMTARPSNAPVAP